MTPARPAIAAGALLLLLTGCTKATSPGAHALRQVQWRLVTVPGSACFQKEPIQLRAGEATFPASKAALLHDDSGQDEDDLYADTGQVTYADVTGDGLEDAFLPLTCTNGGGTADGQLLFSYVLFSGTPKKLRAIGLITPQVQRPDVHATLIYGDLGPGIHGQTIQVDEGWYGPNDCTAGPTGEAVTTWVYAHGRLKVKSSKITAQSTGSCPPP